MNSVLIVDDDDDIRETFADALRFVGYPVLTAPNGKAALDLLAKVEAPPCLILLDMMMPVMDGEEFRKHQLANSELAEIPVVVISADRDALQQAMLLGAADGLSKPIQFDALSNVARKYCGEAA